MEWLSIPVCGAASPAAGTPDRSNAASCTAHKVEKPASRRRTPSLFSRGAFLSGSQTARSDSRERRCQASRRGAASVVLEFAGNKILSRISLR
jgi:hypothetical protein